MKARLELARTIAEEAGKLTLRYFGNSGSFTVEQKADASPVTEADREAELLLRKRIAETFPDDAVFGEEFPSKNGSSGFCWYLDPIDGTKSFIHGVPLYSTLVGLEHNGLSVAGVIVLPALHELVWAGIGLGCWRDINCCGQHSKREPLRCQVSSCNNIAEAAFLTSEVKTYDKTNRFEAYRRLEQNVRLTRTWGDAYGYVLTATGRADIMVDPQLSSWDAGPLLVVLKEAGGRFTDWQGNETIHNKEGVATNGLLHEAVLTLLTER
jgi:histidinol phosphatase-like enzyme (inositol monophosphatase family)